MIVGGIAVNQLFLVGNYNPSLVRVFKDTFRLIDPNFSRTVNDSPDFILNLSFLIFRQDRDVALAGCPVHRRVFRSFQMVGPYLFLGRLKCPFIWFSIESFSPQHVPKLWSALFMNFDEVSNLGDPFSTISFWGYELRLRNSEVNGGTDFTYLLNSRPKRRFP